MNPIFRNLAVGGGLALAAATSFAVPPMEMLPGDRMPPPMMQPGREPTPPFLRGIQLTDEQRDKIFDIMYAQAPALRAREKELRQSMDALRKLPLTAEFDDAKAKALANTAARAMSEIELMRARTDHKIMSLLTTEQRRHMDDADRPSDASCDKPPRRR